MHINLLQRSFFEFEVVSCECAYVCDRDKSSTYKLHRAFYDNMTINRKIHRVCVMDLNCFAGVFSPQGASCS